MGRDGGFGELGLAAVALRWNHHAAGNGVGYLGSMVATHDVQGEVDSGCGSRRGENLPGVDIEHVGSHVDGGELLG